MSRENVEVVRKVFDAAARGDTEAALALYDPQVEWDSYRSPVGTLMGRRLYHGHEGLRRFFNEYYDAWEHLEDSAEELIDAGEQVVSAGTTRSRGRASGMEVERTNYGVWTIREGKVVMVVWFDTREEALEAVGLRE
jgi:ketosteroid isomerase-like protein